MPENDFTISIEQAQKLAKETEAIGGAVQQMLQSTGWQIFLAIFNLKELEIREKDDYETLEAFRADRKAIAIVHAMFEEFRGYIDGAKDAQANLEKLIEQLGQTPSSTMILGGEETGEQG